VSLVIVESRAAKASKREQKACWNFTKKTNPLSVDHQPKNILYISELGFASLKNAREKSPKMICGQILSTNLSLNLI